MNINVNIIDKPQKNITEYEKIKTPEDVIKKKDVQAIRNAIREHLLFIGLNNQNEVINTTLLGIGTTNNIIIDTKEIIRNALFTASDKMLPTYFDYQPKNSKDKIMDAEKPVELIEEIIEYISKPFETLLDQYAGSGNFVVACYNTNRNSIAIEKDKEMFAKMKDNIEKNIAATFEEIDYDID